MIERGIRGPKVADIGTGSGILAIAAAILNCNFEVVALDNNVNALENARVNIRLNHVDGRIKLLHGQPEDITDGNFNTLLSNLTCEDIIALLPIYERLLLPGGQVVCAGILSEKQNVLEAALADFPFHLSQADIDGEWLGAILQRT